MALTHKAPLKEELKKSTPKLAHLTEKRDEELFEDLCRSDNVTKYHFLINEKFSGGIEETAAVSSALNEISTGSTTETPAVGETGYAKRTKDSRRNAFLGIPAPKFNINYSKTTEDTHQFKQLWKVARPLLAELIVAVEERR